MALSQTAIRTVFGNLLAASPKKVTVTIGVDDYIGPKTVLNRDIRYSLYGRQDDYRFSVILNWIDFSSLPAVDSTVTISGTTYRVLGAEEDSTDVAIRLDLGQQYA